VIRIESALVAPGVTVADATDTGGNTFTITPREGSTR